MAEQSHPNDESSTALPNDSLVPLESILCTEELNRRPARPPDYETENRALVALVQALADSPRTILQTLADKILEVFQADSAGISLLTKEDGGKGSTGRRSPAHGNRTSAAARRAISARAVTCSTATPRYCSTTSNGVTPISCRSRRRSKSACSFLFTSKGKQSGRSGRSPTMTAASSTPRTSGSLKAWAGLHRRRIRRWRPWMCWSNDAKRWGKVTPNSPSAWPSSRRRTKKLGNRNARRST